jgi:RNA 3'-terminal phosphate cyclase (ATP)
MNIYLLKCVVIVHRHKWDREASSLFKVDGSYGEGGGQIVRTAISLSAITRKSIEIINIRANRVVAGLRRQHLTAVKATADLFHAKVENLRLGTDWIRFIPSSDKFEEGSIKIDVQSAGSIPMILLTLIPAVSLSGKSLSIQITGGTDTRMSPTADYLRYVVSEAYRNIGIKFGIHILKRGYYPKGGGVMVAEINPCKLPNSIDLVTTRQLEPKIAGVCCQLPKHVGERQISSALLRLEKNGVHCNSYSSSYETSISPGSSILVYSKSDFGPYIGGDSIGERGKPAEQVGAEAAERFLETYKANVPVDFLLADMLVVPLSLTKGKSRYRVGKVTEHLRTNLHIASQIVGCKYNIEPTDNNYLVNIGRLD